jgi:tetratricopeptide (TPR) repeat protein
MRKYDDAVKMFERSIEMSRKIYPKDNVEIAKTILMLGRTHKYAGNKKEALKHIQSALSIFEKGFAKPAENDLVKKAKSELADL